MSESSSSHPEGIAGCYRTEAGEWTVTLARVGEACALTSLRIPPAAVTAHADDQTTLAACFFAPRAGAERYPDWAHFEWETRLCVFGEHRSTVWRIAEDVDRVAYLGLAVPRPAGTHLYPMAAALWRGWSRRGSRRPHALFWDSGRHGHLWLRQPAALPHYIGLEANASPEAVVLALGAFIEPETVTLEVGGVTPARRQALARVHPGLVRPVAPFADLIISPALRAELSALPDATGYLPAIGAARALAEGAPRIEPLCESLPEAMAADG